MKMSEQQNTGIVAPYDMNHLEPGARETKLKVLNLPNKAIYLLHIPMIFFFLKCSSEIHNIEQK